ncbi:ATP-binding response regulator [Azospirillum picis]|uniref:histidine kinase n=1 Tax=Azospirillum picis TaxID=488438 RepID=A0ABU0ME62_9PROT|nr:ATP-binding protein [Azospirillum picis]MBP2297887.1 signal transduction histidine kinase [Azospirillum picis]MDQ0531725.1 signal transduction histidine kinase [Azospirillum picis]
MNRSQIDPALARQVKDAGILIVDDNPSNVDLLREILGHDGYTRVRGETDPRKVPDLCASEPFDLLLIDVRMPHMSGFELMERLKPVFDGDYVPILVLTAQTDQETRRKSLELGANDFLTKPFIAWELLHRVRNMVEIRKLYRRAAEQNRELERRVEERTAELSEALEAARKADRAKLDFLAVMSHELRTPLNSIIGFADVLAAEGMGKLGHPDYLEYVKLIEDSGKSLLTMVNNILDYTRGSTGAVELQESDVDIPQLMSGCADLLAPKATLKRLTVAVQSCPSFRMRGDRRRLREMVLNLLDNAVKFTPADGHITLAVEDRDGYVGLSVRDDGPGIPAELMGRIFNPFTQAERSLVRQHEGVGLGLPIVRRFAELHGGGVALDSVPGGGTTVTILLPKERLLVA